LGVRLTVQIATFKITFHRYCVGWPSSPNPFSQRWEKGNRKSSKFLAPLAQDWERGWGRGPSRKLLFLSKKTIANTHPWSRQLFDMEPTKLPTFFDFWMSVMTSLEQVWTLWVRLTDFHLSALTAKSTRAKQATRKPMLLLWLSALLWLR
jgi:hypothetical protein